MRSAHNQGRVGPNRVPTRSSAQSAPGVCCERSRHNSGSQSRVLVLAALCYHRKNPCSGTPKVGLRRSGSGKISQLCFKRKRAGKNRNLTPSQKYGSGLELDYWNFDLLLSSFLKKFSQCSCSLILCPQ